MCNVHTIDDRHEILNIYKSQCARCKHFNKYTCPAFPKGIPEDMLVCDKTHDMQFKDQEGNTVFEMLDDFL